jgi:hypothetical protein
MGRIRSLQIVADIDVFVDCLSLRPGEEWKTVLAREINKREIFWLFWSREAIASKFVEWEWRTAYAQKGKNGIQPHPLEPTNLAPPPKELEDLQFGAAFEVYMYGLRSNILSRRLNQLRVLLRQLRSLWHKQASLLA